MTDQEIKELFILQSRNVRFLKKVKKNLTMDINYYLIKGDTFKVKIKTNFLSLLYSSLSESQFLQILHTPNGFRYAEIQKILNERSIVGRWKLMLDIALKKVGDVVNNHDLKEKRKFLIECVNEYIEKPQFLRNKIAHGQWVHALNSKNTKENINTSFEIQSLNVVEVTKWFEVHQYLCFIIRDLVQSPHKGFHNNYWINFTKLKAFVNKSKNWTLEKRLKTIKRNKKNV